MHAEGAPREGSGLRALSSALQPRINVRWWGVGRRVESWVSTFGAGRPSCRRGCEVPGLGMRMRGLGPGAGRRCRCAVGSECGVGVRLRDEAIGAR